MQGAACWWSSKNEAPDVQILLLARELPRIRLGFPACKRTAKQVANTTGSGEASPWAASLAPCCANILKSKTVQTWRQKYDTWLHPTSLRPPCSKCTSLSVYIWLPMEEKKKGRERENKSRMTFSWGHSSTLPLRPTDIVHVSTTHSLVHATAMPTHELLTRLQSKGGKRGFNENPYHEDATNQRPVCNSISCKTKFICRRSNN